MSYLLSVAILQINSFPKVFINTHTSDSEDICVVIGMRAEHNACEPSKRIYELLEKGNE